MSTEKTNRKRWLWPSLILSLAVVAGWALISTAPQTAPEDKARAVRVVQVSPIAPTSEKVSVSAQGPVVPARRVTIVPQVSGRVVEHHEALMPGGFVREGEELVRVDPADYQLALTEKEAAAEQAIFEQQVESGRQVVASREWKLLEGVLGENEVNRALVLREPHLRRTEALLRMATNEIARARFDLSRTSIKAPFNAIVVEENVEAGQVVDAGTSICTLAGTDEFWVQATLPIDKLRWIRLPAPGREGAAATVLLDTGNGQPLAWEGQVVRLLSDLEPTGRMARVLVRVKDPLGLKEPGEKVPLLLGSFVQVQIDAGSLEDVLVIPRAALREGNQIWVVDSSNELQIRPAEILWTRGDEVLIANVVKPGEQLVRSELKAPLPGMKVNPQPLIVPSSAESTASTEVIAVSGAAQR
jgi:RND family efflux transporter MFP subunit